MSLTVHRRTFKINSLITCLWNASYTMSIKTYWTLLLIITWLSIILLYTIQKQGSHSVLVGTRIRIRNTYDEASLINTPGCTIPDYSKNFTFIEASNLNRKCGFRAIFVHRVVGNEVNFTIKDWIMKEYSKDKYYECCYNFARRSTQVGSEDMRLNYTTCIQFKNGTRITLIEEVIGVTCRLPKNNRTIYTDVYIIVKKKQTKRHESPQVQRRWNIILLGLDTMSRARLKNSMPQTYRYLQENTWLDYKGYQKVGYNTFPNVMSFMTGMKMAKVYKACAGDIHKCNDKFIWSKFKDAGFVTAHGEDYVHLPNTFAKYHWFSVPPTDHYMKPFYLTGETLQGNLVCTRHLSSGAHMLNYIKELTDVYKDENLFGMFWLNSYTHNFVNLPKLFDESLVEFFYGLQRSGTLNHTFVLFLSDHGIRTGPMRLLISSYYDERLPMFFMWTPLEFRQLYPKEFKNLQLNVNRLITPYDLHMTMWNILKIQRPNVEVIPAQACPMSTSIMEEVSPHRTCADACVADSWCSCHGVEEVHADLTTLSLTYAVAQAAVLKIQENIRSIETKPCTVCAQLNVSRVIRHHKYNLNNSTQHVVALTLSPGRINVECVLREYRNKTFDFLNYNLISRYKVYGNCAINYLLRHECVCRDIEECKT